MIQFFCPRKCFIWWGGAKVRFFFFPGNSLGVTHSLKFWKSVFFFFPKNWKKKNKCFLFFSRNSLGATHSKIFETLYFYIGKSRLACFFFPTIFGMIFVFFFPRKSLPSLTHSIEKRVFFFRVPEKKNGFFPHSLDFRRNIPKNKLFPGKKKTLPLHGPCRVLEC